MAKPEKLMEHARPHMEPDEVVMAFAMGGYETKVMGHDGVRTGILMATDRRVVFYAKKMMGFDLEVFPYESIKSIESSKGMMGHSVAFLSSGNKVSMKWIKDSPADLVNAVKDRMGRMKAPEPAALDPVTTLKQLGNLRDAGVITVEEFDAKKAEVLARM